MEVYKKGVSYSLGELDRAIELVDGRIEDSDGPAAIEGGAFAPALGVNPQALHDLWLGQAAGAQFQNRALVSLDYRKFSSAAASDDGNRRGGTAYWWGWEVYLDSATTNAVIGILTGGSGFEGIMAAIAGALGPIGVPVVIVAGVVAGIMALDAGIFTVANAQGRGVVMRGLWIPAWYVWSQ